MKRILFLMSFLLLLLVGCGKTPEETTVSISKKGVITQTIVEEWDQANYDEAEFEADIEAQIEEYGTELVSLKSCEVKKNVITVVMEYATAADYAAFNGVQCFDGTIAEADAAGLIMNGTYYDTEGKETSQHKVLEDSTERVLILNEPVAVEVPGAIVYVKDGVELLGKKKARITGQENAASQEEGSSVTEETSGSALPETDETEPPAVEFSSDVNEQWQIWLSQPGIIIYKTA